MKKREKFYNRKEVVEFLKGYNFNHFIPYIKEDGNSWYVVELTANNKIDYCYEEYIKGGFAYSHPFYDYKRIYDFDLEEVGEKKRLENIEMEKYFSSLE